MNLKENPDLKKLDLYYGKFKYRYVLDFPGVHYFRYVKDLRHVPGRLRQSVYSSTNDVSGRIIKKTINELLESDDMLDNIIKFITFKNTIPNGDALIAVSSNRVAVYCTKDEIVKRVESLFGDRVMYKSYIPDAVVGKYEKNAIYHVNPKHKFRLHFNRIVLTGDSMHSFLRIIEQNKCKTSYTLNRYIRLSTGNSKLFLSPSTYVDYSDDHLITMLGLAVGNVIRTITPINKR